MSRIYRIYTIFKRSESMSRICRIFTICRIKKRMSRICKIFTICKIKEKAEPVDGDRQISVGSNLARFACSLPTTGVFKRRPSRYGNRCVFISLFLIL